MKTISLVLTIFIFLSCEKRSEIQSKTDGFIFPKVLNTYADTIVSKPFEAENISEVFPTFMGIYRFQDTIDINPRGEYWVKNIPEFTAWEKAYRRLTERNIKNFDVNGLEIFTDYGQTVKYKRYRHQEANEHYPVYFVNSTNSPKVLLGKDSYVFGIQEAGKVEDYGRWNPIEARGFDFCGNGRWERIIYPNEFALVLMRKYKGDYETKLRVRFRMGANTYVSKAFTGKINKKQFNLVNNSRLQESLQESNGLSASWLFYGAVPEESEWVVMSSTSN